MGGISGWLDITGENNQRSLRYIYIKKYCSKWNADNLKMKIPLMSFVTITSWLKYIWLEYSNKKR